MGALIRGFDWAATSLGAPTHWPQSLRTALDMTLHSPVPMLILWGRDGTLLYNDAYAAIAGDRHRQLLGMTVLEAPDVAKYTRDALDAGMQGASLSLRNVALVHNGNAVQITANLDCSPISDESGSPAGVLVVIIDTTQSVTDRQTIADLTQQLARANERLNQLFTQAPGFKVLLRGPQLVVELVNSSYRDLVTQREMLGLPIREALRNHSSEEFFNLLDTVYGTGKPFKGDQVEIASSRGPGEMAFLNLVLHPFTDAQGRGLLIEGHDVTASVQATRALQTGARKQAALLLLGDRLRDLGDASEIIRTSSEIVGRTLQVMRVAYLRLDDSSAGAQRLGEWIDDDAVPSPSMANFIPHGTHVEEIRQGLNVMIDDVSIDPRTAQFDAFWQSIGVGAALFVPVIEHGIVAATLRVHHATPRHWTPEEASFMRDAADRTFVALERARAFAALRQSEADLRLITDNLPAMISYLDNDLTYRFVNRSYEEWLGLPREQIIGRTVSEVFGPDGDVQRVSRLRGALAGEHSQYESSIVALDGSLREIELRMAPRYDAQGGVQGLYVFIFDITKRKQAESELHRVNESLEHAVTERTNELRAAEEQLRQSQKMEAIGQLTGGIAHDFNNILQGIIGGLEAVQRRLKADRKDGIDQFMDAVVNSANRAAGLTHRLLAFSRRQSLDAKPVDVNLLVSSMSELIRQSLNENDRLDVDLSDDLWPAETDANQLESALLNLAINARDAMNSGGMLTIRTRNMPLDSSFTSRIEWLQPGDYVSLQISDTGDGMSPEVLQRAFEPFFTTKPIGAGTGLGLSMIYGFARQSRGYVNIDSEVGRGTTVTLYLPRSLISSTRQAAGPPLPAIQIGEGATVLIVEDDAAVRMVVNECLRDLGYRTLKAVDGLKAVDILRTQHIDLLVTDVGLPGMNGRQVADVARQSQPDLNVLFMTGYAQNAVLRSGFLDQGMAMIIKPFSSEAFIAKVRETTYRGTDATAASSSRPVQPRS